MLAGFSRSVKKMSEEWIRCKSWTSAVRFRPMAGGSLVTGLRLAFIVYPFSPGVQILGVPLLQMRVNSCWSNGALFVFAFVWMQYFRWSKYDYFFNTANKQFRFVRMFPPELVPQICVLLRCDIPPQNHEYTVPYFETNTIEHEENRTLLRFHVLLR